MSIKQTQQGTEAILDQVNSIVVAGAENEALPEVIYFKRKALTTSLAVAKFFNKQHKNILQAIEKIECSEEFSRLNFQPSE